MTKNPGTKALGGRPATGSIEWKRNPQTRVFQWYAQITLADGTRPRVALDPSIAHADAVGAQACAAVVSARARELGVVAATRGETVAEYAERWLAYREERGLACVSDDRSRLARHVLPHLGTREVAAVTRAELEDLVDRLDTRVRTHDLGWKVAQLAWSNVSQMFRDASSSKRRVLRVRPDNPAAGVQGPDRGVRKAKQYLYPAEVLALLASNDVPLRWRELFAIGAYTFARTGELEALEWADIDLDRRAIHIHRNVDRVRKRGEVKPTKTKQARRLPIEPALAPLLVAMHERADGKGRVLKMPSPGMLSRKLRFYLRRVGVARGDLFVTDETRKAITFYDATRATGITWAAVRGDDPLRIKQRAGHASFSTTEGYIREAENLAEGFGVPFPTLPEQLSREVTEGFAPGFALRAKLRRGTAKKAGFLVGATGFEEGGDASPIGEKRAEPSPATSENRTGSLPPATSACETSPVLDGSNAATPDPTARHEVDAALARAIEAAAKAGQWDAVCELADRLRARRA